MTGGDQQPVATSDYRERQPNPQQHSIKSSDHLDIVMGLTYNIYLNSSRIYGCKNCKTHLSNHDDILSRNFRGQHGKAYLFDSVVNITESDPNERNMTTGRHIVRDIHCRQCKETVGWKYDKAYEASEKYKEGKFILEEELLCTVT